MPTAEIKHFLFPSYLLHCQNLDCKILQGRDFSFFALVNLQSAMRMDGSILMDCDDDHNNVASNKHIYV